jgi:polysaccharide export outer membrane protein
MRVGLCLVLGLVGLQSLGLAQVEKAAAVGAAERSAAPIACSDTYRICPGDTLSIAVDGEDVFTQECQVNGAGTISYPMLGDVPAAGATCSDLRARLEEDLSRYLKHPTVMITVKEYGQVGMSVFVMGEVRSPGVYPLAGGSGLMQPLAAAGGLTEYASGQVTVMKRTGESWVASLEDVPGSGAGGILEPGDVILVQRRLEQRYAVLGEVPTPGMFDMPAQGEVRVLDAMTQAGLLEPSTDASPGAPGSLLDNPIRTADLEHASVTRGEVVIPVDLAALLAGDAGQNIVLRSGDVLTVPQLPVVRVYALGEVKAAGRHNLPEPASVLDLLSAAGGITASARPSDASIIRMVDGEPAATPLDIGDLLRDGDSEENPSLQEGDVLFVPARGESNRNVWRLLSVLPYLIF